MSIYALPNEAHVTSLAKMDLKPQPKITLETFVQESAHTYMLIIHLQAL